MDEFLGKLEGFFFGNGVTIAKTLSVLIFGLIIVRLLLRLFKNLTIKYRLERTMASFLNSIIGVGLYFLLFLLVGNMAGLSTASFVTVVGAAGLAVSLALKDSLSNLANGFIILGSKPFVLGDYVDIGSIGGTIRSIGIFNTKLITPDEKIITIPNSQIVGSAVINYSSTPTRRLDVEFTVAYESDVDKVKKVVLNMINDIPEVLKQPEPYVVMSEFLESSLKFTARLWLPNDVYWKVKFAFNENLLKAFREKEIEIPYNKLDVNVLSNKGGNNNE